MTSPTNWLHAQCQQPQPPHHHLRISPSSPYPSIYRSATPPPRPRSAATNSPQRGRQVIPGSLSVLHSRPAGAPPPPPPPPLPPRNAAPSPAPPPPLLYVGGSHQDMEAVPAAEQASGGSLQVDYSAIQRIADGVERMVRSWSSENSCRAQVYAKAYDSLHAAAVRGKDQQAAATPAQQQYLSFLHEPTTATSTETNSSPFNLSAYNGQADLLNAMRTLQSPAEPSSVENAHGLLKMQPRLGDNDGEQRSSQDNHGGPLPYAGNATYHDANWSMGALYGPSSRLPGLTSHGKALYSCNNNLQCVHNHTHPYPLGFGPINELDDTEQSRNAGCMSKVGSYNERDYDPPFHRVNTPVLRDDVVNSSSCSSLVKHAPRSRSPSWRLGALSNNASHALDLYQNADKTERRLDEKYQAKVKELEISLLECATEYEVQIVEMKMKMLQMKSEFRQKAIVGDVRSTQARLMLPAPTHADATNLGQSSSRYNRQLGHASIEVSPDQSLESPKLKRRVLKDRNYEITPSSQSKPRLFSVVKSALVPLFIPFCFLS